MGHIWGLYTIIGRPCTMGSFKGAGNVGMGWRLIWRIRIISVFGEALF